MTNNPPLYLVDGGETFTGTVEQFRDCFFSNATEALMTEFCQSQGWRLEVVRDGKTSVLSEGRDHEVQD